MPWFIISHGTATSSKLTCSRYRAPAIGAADRVRRISGVKWWNGRKKRKNTLQTCFTHVDLGILASIPKITRTLDDVDLRFFAVLRFSSYSIQREITWFSKRNESQNYLVSWLSLPKFNLPWKTLQPFISIDYFHKSANHVTQHWNLLTKSVDLLNTNLGYGLKLCRRLEEVGNCSAEFRISSQLYLSNSSCLILSGCILCCFLKPFFVAAHSLNEIDGER